MSGFIPADLGVEESSSDSSDEDRPSAETLAKVAKMKERVKAQVSARMKYVSDRKQRTAQVKSMIVGHGLKESDNPELMDLMHDYFDKERSELRAMRVKTRATDFEVLKLIGKGGFGEVRMVRHKKRGTIHAMKSMVKKEMIEGKQASHIKSERDLMVTHHSDYLIRLDFAFTDKKYVYLVMEFCPGGDYMALLIKRDKLAEKDCAFYMNELALGIDAVHKLGYVHRDLKPDNMLITGDGHIKLTDFGLSKLVAKDANDEMLEEVAKAGDTLTAAPTAEEVERAVKKTDVHAKHHGRELMMSTVGTPDYIAPEVLERKGYDFRVDWWSWGTILFESVFGFPPFYDKTPLHTCKRIIHFRQYFRIPRPGPDKRHPSVSGELVDILSNSICIARRRFVFEDIARHEWFNECLGVAFEDVSEQVVPPFVPKLKSEIDTAHFDESELKEPTHVIGDAAYALSGDEDGDHRGGGMTGDDDDDEDDDPLNFFERQATDQFDGFTFKGSVPKSGADPGSPTTGAPSSEAGFEDLMSRMRDAHEVAVAKAKADGRYPTESSGGSSSSTGTTSATKSSGTSRRGGGRSTSPHSSSSSVSSHRSGYPSTVGSSKSSRSIAGDASGSSRGSSKKRHKTEMTSTSRKKRAAKGSLTPEEFQKYFIQKYRSHYPEATDEEVVVAYKKYMASKVKPRSKTTAGSPR